MSAAAPGPSRDCGSSLTGSSTRSALLKWPRWPRATFRAGTAADRAAAPGAGVVTTATAVAVRTLRKYMRSPQLLVTSIASGAIFIVLFRYIFGGAIKFGTVPYVDFLIPGMVLTSVLITGTGTAVGVAEDRDQGCWPAGRWATSSSWPGRPP